MLENLRVARMEDMGIACQGKFPHFSSYIHPAEAEQQTSLSCIAPVTGYDDHEVIRTRDSKCVITTGSTAAPTRTYSSPLILKLFAGRWFHEMDYRYGGLQRRTPVNGILLQAHI